MKSAALTVAAIAVVLFGCYGLVIGTKPPCEAFRERLLDAMKDDPPDVAEVSRKVR